MAVSLIDERIYNFSFTDGDGTAAQASSKADQFLKELNQGKVLANRASAHSEMGEILLGHGAYDEKRAL